MAAEPNTYVFEASMKLNSVCPSKNFLQIVFVNNSSNYHYGQLNMSVDNNGVACLAGVPIGYFDEWFDLRMEYHFNEGLIRIYSNGLFMGEVTTFSESDTITDKKVSALESVTDFSVGTINSGGAFSFSIDNMAISMQSIEYSKRDLESLPLPNPAPDNFIPTLPEPEPEPDPTPTPTPTPTPGGNNTPDLEFPGMEPPMDVPDDVTPGDPNLDDKEDMGDWTGALI
jgi:hypothetical protein